MPTRIPYPDLATRTPRVQEIVGAAPINVSRMMANASPAIRSEEHTSELQSH